MCLLFESIRVENGRALALEYHQRRVCAAISAFGISQYSGQIDVVNGINLSEYISGLDLPLNGVHKLRIIYSQAGVESHSVEPYTPRKISSLRLVNGDSLCYDRKYLDRTGIDSLFKRRGGCDDILIVKNGLITDSSFSNVAIFDSNKSLWVTPAAPLLEGTCRAALLDSGALTPASISADSILKPGRYTKIVLINAMLPFDEKRSLSIPEALF